LGDVQVDLYKPVGEVGAMPRALHWSQGVAARNVLNFLNFTSWGLLVQQFGTGGVATKSGDCVWKWVKKPSELLVDRENYDTPPAFG